MTRSPGVIVIGSINIDDSLRMHRLPAPGETVGARSVTTELGGKGANQAVAAARAGAGVRMIGAVGDEDSALPLQRLASEGIDTDGIARLAGTPSGRALVMVDGDAENSIVVVPGANHAIPDTAVEQACSRLGPGDAVLLQHEIPARISRLAASLAHRAGARVIWNAAPAPEHLEELVEDIDLLVVNQHELAVIADLLDDGISVDAAGDDDVDAMLRRVAQNVDADVICTLGAAGAASLIAGEPARHRSPAVDAVDTTAAGDTFVGYLAAGMVRGEDPARAIRTAAEAGALAVTRRGAADSIPHHHEVASRLTLDERTAG